MSDEATRDATRSPPGGGARLRFQRFLECDLDPAQASPELLRRLRVLNAGQLLAIALCPVVGGVWAVLVSPAFVWLFGSACLAWLGLVWLLRRTLRPVACARLGLGVLFYLNVGSSVLAGGIADYATSMMIVPVAAAAMVGGRDAWAWAAASAIVAIGFVLTADTGLWASPVPTSAAFQIPALLAPLLVIAALSNVWATSQHQMEKRLDTTIALLQKEAERVRILLEATTMANGQMGFQAASDSLLAQARATWGFEAGSVWTVEPGIKELRLLAVRPADARGRPEGLVTHVWKTRRPRIVEEDGRQRLACPISSPRERFGVLEFYCQPGRRTPKETLDLASHVAGQLAHVAARERAGDAARWAANHDPLTGLSNRRAFHETLTKTIEATALEQGTLGLLFIDLNAFKRINDSLGHAAGDKVLRATARRLRKTLRLSDHLIRCGPLSERISRLGGDEFMVVLNGLSAPGDADAVATRMLEAIRKPINLAGNQVRIEASIGIAIYPDESTDPDVLIRCADAGMYAAKRAGGNVFRHSRGATTATLGIWLETALRSALQNGELRMHFQPILDCQTGRTVGAEALMRWLHPERGWIPPVEFIPLAERTGMIRDLGFFALDESMNWLDESLGALPANFRVSVNVSPSQIEDPLFAKHLAARLARASFSATRIELELTETALMNESPEMHAQIRTLDRTGVAFALDDFGTGYSSLSLVKRFPISRLKIDRSFVTGLPDNAENVAIASAILGMAKSLNVAVVAEGVEDEAEAEFLITRGCTEMQGYLFGRPAPPEDLVSRVLAEAAGAMGDAGSKEADPPTEA